MVYTVVFKRYAPFSTFGGGFHGDGRVLPSPFASARTWGFVSFELSQGVIGFAAMSSPTWHKWTPGNKDTQKPSIKLSREKKSGTELTFTAHTAGANPQTPGYVTPAIDTFLDIRLTPTEINGCLRGDDFPSAEVYLLSGEVNPNSLQCSHHQLLCHFATPHGGLEGPATRLWGKHGGQWLTAFNKKLTI